jgi:hypothetical protein
MDVSVITELQLIFVGDFIPTASLQQLCLAFAFVCVANS